MDILKAEIAIIYSGKTFCERVSYSLIFCISLQEFIQGAQSHVRLGHLSERIALIYTTRIKLRLLL